MGLSERGTEQSLFGRAWADSNHAFHFHSMKHAELAMRRAKCQEASSRYQLDLKMLVGLDIRQLLARRIGGFFLEGKFSRVLLRVVVNYEFGGPFWSFEKAM